LGELREDAHEPWDLVKSYLLDYGLELADALKSDVDLGHLAELGDDCSGAWELGYCTYDLINVSDLIGS